MALATPAQGPDPEHPHTIPGMMACSCNPSGEAETGGALQLAGWLNSEL